VSPKALAICSSCPVRQECLDRAMADPRMAGMWSGTTEREWQEIRVQRAALATGFTIAENE
jgi:WhiB family transcriptional regulator, redox-sensing transcriptional regulator